MIKKVNDCAFFFQFDIKNNRLFLKRTKCEGLRLENMYIGATVDLFSRQINFIDYADDFTKGRLAQQKERLVFCERAYVPLLL